MPRRAARPVSCVYSPGVSSTCASPLNLTNRSSTTGRAGMLIPRAGPPAPAHRGRPAKPPAPPAARPAAVGGVARVAGIPLKLAGGARPRNKVEGGVPAHHLRPPRTRPVFLSHHLRPAAPGHEP